MFKEEHVTFDLSGDGEVHSIRVSKRNLALVQYPSKVVPHPVISWFIIPLTSSIYLYTISPNVKLELCEPQLSAFV